MSNAGRPPLPSFVKQLRGTLVAGDGSEPQPDPAVYIQPPIALKENHPHACDFWEAHLPLLVKNGMISEVDMAGFASACLAYERWLEAEKELGANGKVQKTENGYQVESPYVSIAKQARKEYVEFLREFGLTPSSRTRLKIQLVGAPDGGAREDGDQLFFDY